MTRAFGIVGLLVFLIGEASAQRPVFEVASIKRHPPGEVVAPGTGGFKVSPDGSVTSSYTTLKMYVQWAYSVAGEISGPGWIEEERYDIAAKAAAPALIPQLKLMFQSLLEDRFRLRVHLEMKQSPVIALVVAKNGTKNLRQVESGGKFEIQRGEGTLTVKNAPMSAIATILGSPFGNMPLEKVVDQTELSGSYDIALDLQNFDPRNPEFGGSYQEMRSSLRLFVSDALEKQYGLKLEQRNVPLQSLVIDDANKIPTEN